MKKATDILKYPYEVRKKVKQVDIVPNIKNNLMNIGKYTDAGYISFFDDEEVNIYGMNNTSITVLLGSVLRGWRGCHETGFWRIPLLQNVTNLNTETVICKAPPTKHLPNRPSPTEAVHNVYGLQTIPEIIQYFHT